MVLSPVKISEKDIFDICKDIGIPCKMPGYKYIKSGIIKISEDENKLYNIMKLYKEIGLENNISGARVERTIRLAIEKAFIYGGTEIINKIFGSAYDAEIGRPSNAEFLGNLYEYLKYNKRSN